MRVQEVIAHCYNQFIILIFLLLLFVLLLFLLLFLLLSLDISPVLQRFIEMVITCKLIAHQLFLQDMDQHANAWSRCLNSCLLTLATATLAIQKMGEQSVKDEVLNSKEGATYFSGMREFVMSSKLTYKLLQSEPGYKNQLDSRNC